MELQGKKQAAADFLTLFKDPSFPDSISPRQGFFPKTRDFLQPLERAEVSVGGGAGTARQRRSPPPAAARQHAGLVEHVPSLSAGTCGDDHVCPVSVKPEWPTCGKTESGAMGAATAMAATKRNTFTLWEEEATAWPGGDGGVISGEGTQQRWLDQSLLPARGGTNGSFASFPSFGDQRTQDKRHPMVAPSTSSRGFLENDDEVEEDFSKEEKPHSREIAVKIDNARYNEESTSKDQGPSTPRSKHSATEQRRRTKINDRFQILRDLVPHSDQKRDKASFLLEVINYIHCLQEKVQKYEPSCPGWNRSSAKLIPWKKCQEPGASMVDHSNAIKDHPTSTSFVFPTDNAIENGPRIMPSNQNVIESKNLGASLTLKSVSMAIPVQYHLGTGSGFSQHQMKFISDSESMAAQPHSLRLRSGADASATNAVLSGNEGIAVDEGASSLSSLYSKRLLTTLTDTLRNSGVDISQASISVQINLHRRTDRRISSVKDHDDSTFCNRPPSAFGSNGDESERRSKRHKSDST